MYEEDDHSDTDSSDSDVASELDSSANASCVGPSNNGASKLLRIKTVPAPSLCQRRMSSRVVQHSTDNEMYSIIVDGVKWTSMERVSLLLGLKKYGMLDLKNLQNVVPTKTEKEIKRCIQVSWKLARNTLTVADKKKKKRAKKQGLTESDGPPIEKWLHEIETVTPKQKPVYNRALPMVFYAIAKFEDHPSPSECGGVDYREAYEYLHLMLAGFPGKSLSPPTAKFVLKSLTQLGERIRSKDRGNAMNFLHWLETISSKCKPVRTYTKTVPTKQRSEGKKENEVDTDEAFRTLMELPGFNPLDVPFKYLRSDETH